MAGGNKPAISRTRCRVRIVSFNDMLTEGFVFLAYNQRLSDLLNDDRGFLPVETEDGEVKVVSKRAIMEVEILEQMDRRHASRYDDAVPLLSANAFEVLGVPGNADDATIRLRYLELKETVNPERLGALSANKDLATAAEHLAKRYDAAYDSITNARKIEAIAIAMRDSQTKRRRFGEK